MGYAVSLRQTSCGAADHNVAAAIEGVCANRAAGRDPNQRYMGIAESIIANALAGVRNPYDGVFFGCVKERSAMRSISFIFLLLSQ